LSVGTGDAGSVHARPMGLARVLSQRVLVATCALVALTLLLAAGISVIRHVTVPDHRALRAGAHSLSAGAEAQINPALGANSPSYFATRVVGGWTLAADGIRARIGRRDLVAGLGAGSVSLRLSGIGQESRVRSVRPVGALAAHGNRVTLGRGSVREWYAAGPLGVEQGFTVARAPASGPGQLTLTLRIGGSLRPVAAAQGVTFLAHDGHAALRYGGLSAVDARGRSLGTSLILRGRVLNLRVDTRHAVYPVRIDPLLQIGSKIAPDATHGGSLGQSVALDSAGDEAVIGSPGDGIGAGGAWVFSDFGGVWAQVGPELVGDCTSLCSNQGTGEVAHGHFGQSVAVSSDGDTIAVGAPDNGATGTNVSGPGAVWVFTRSGNSVVEQAKLAGTGEVGTGNVGESVALSSSGDTLVAGAPGNGASDVDETPEAGAAWVFTRSGSNWSQQTELDGDCTGSCANEGTGENGNGAFGRSVAVSADGNTALIGAPADGLIPETNATVHGAAFVFTRNSGGAWSEQGGPLANPTPETYDTNFGASTALDGDSFALIGVPLDNAGAGGVWVFTPQTGGRWGKVGSQLTGTGGFGTSVALSGDDTEALIGSPGDGTGAGGASLFSDSGGTWAPARPEIVGDCSNIQICQATDEGSGEAGSGAFGTAVALSSNASVALVGAPSDGGANSLTGAVWSFGPAGPFNDQAAGDLPAVTGPLAVGGTLTCSTGNWQNSPTAYTYQWKSDGNTIPFATGSTYIVTAGNNSHSLTCTVTATNLGGTSAATSLGAAISNNGLTLSPDSDPLLTGRPISATMTVPSQYAGAPGLKYVWSFGDGSAAPASAATVTHTFTHAGVFTVGVVVSADGSEIASVSQTVVVVLTQPPTASMTILRAPVSSTNPAASTDVTQPVAIVPQASLPEESTAASDSIVREDFWLGGDAPPDPPDITCLPDGACGHYTGAALVPPAGSLMPVAGAQSLGSGPLNSSGGQCVVNLSAAVPPRYVNFCKSVRTYSPAAGFGSFSVNFWNAALADIGAPSPGFASTPVTSTLPQTACAGPGCIAGTGPNGYAPLADVNLQAIDGYQGEQGVPYTGCLPGYSFGDYGIADPYQNADCEFITNYGSGLGVAVPTEPASSDDNINAVRFGPYDLAKYGVNSAQQLEDQWNFLYNYATVVGVDTPIAKQFGPATGATEGSKGSVNSRKITMVAYDAEGVASAPVSQSLPLTPPSNPQLSFCLEDVGHSPCVTTPVKGAAAPFAITSGDKLRFKLDPAPDTQDPILYYAISVGQPNTANVKEPSTVGGKTVSDCSWPTDVGSWSNSTTSAPPSQTTGDSGAGGGGGGGNSGGVHTILAPATGPPNPHVRRSSDPATPPVPSFADLLEGAFAPHDCQGYVDRTVNAAAAPGPIPASGPNVTLQSSGAAAVARAQNAKKLGHQSASQGPVTNPSSGVGNPVLITTNPNDLEFTLPHKGTYSVSIAAYNAAGLGAITRIDGLLAEPGRQSGRCETVESASIKIDGHDLAFSGNCMTVIASGSHHHPDLYATTSVMDISGIPIAPASGDAIVIDPNTNQFYVQKCSIPNSDLTKSVNPCSGKPNGKLYLALGGGTDGAPGFAYIPDFKTTTAESFFAPLTNGKLAAVGGGIPKHTITGCALYPGSGVVPWTLTHGATYDDFNVVTTPCIALSTSGQSRVAFWDSLPPGFGNGASSKTASSQVVLYGSDVPAATDVSSHTFGNVARAHPKPVIAGTFPTVPTRLGRSPKDDLPGFPKLPSCPPSTNLKSGLSIPQDTDMGPISLPAGASFCYVQSTGDFIGSVDVQFPADLPLPLGSVKIGIEIGHGHLIDAGGEISSGTGIDLPPTPILLKDLKFDIQTDPTVVAGAITAAVADIVNITGGVIVDAYHSSATTPKVSVEGTADIEGIQFGNFALDFTPQGIGMHVTISKDFGIGSVNINVQGAVGSNGDFYLTGGGHLCLWYCFGVTGLISSDGFAACGSVSFLAFTFSGGLGVAWNGPASGVHAFLGCDLQPYIPPSLASIPGQVRGRSGARRGLGPPTTLPVLAAGSSPTCNEPSDSTQPAGCLNLHETGMCSIAAPKKSGCTSSVVAVQVESLASEEPPGQTPLVTLTGPTGDARTFTTPSQPSYLALPGTVAVGSSDPGQSVEANGLVDQNPVPADDHVTTSSAYCAADANQTVSTGPSSCAKVTTTTIFVEDPGQGEWKLSVDANSAPVVDYAVSDEQPPVSPSEFDPTVRKAVFTGSGSNFVVHVDGHAFASSLLATNRLLFASSLMHSSSLGRAGRATTLPGFDETSNQVDVAPADISRLRAVILKMPAKFTGTVAILDEGSSDGQPTSQVLTPALKSADIPRAGLPMVFEPMLDAGSHQKLVAFLSNSDGIPFRELNLSSFKAPGARAPSSPKVVSVVHAGPTLKVYFDLGDASTANGVNLAITEPDGVEFQQTITGSQLHPIGALHGIGLQRHASKYMLEVHDVDPSESLKVVLDTVNDGLLSRPSRIATTRASFHAPSMRQLRTFLNTQVLVRKHTRRAHNLGQAGGGAGDVLEPIR
jgi:PKD domain